MASVERNSAVYVISVVAELAGVHPQTLRIYERKGLLDPARTGGGSRRYSPADLDRLHRIQELIDEGLNLAGVRRVLDLEDQLAQLEERMVHLRYEALAVAERTAKKYRRELMPLTPVVDMFGGEKWR